MRIVILTAAELTRDPRARRAALAAAARGLDVVGVCGRVTGDTPAQLPGISIRRVGGDRVTGALRSRSLGGMRRSRALVRELRGVWRLGRQAAATARLAAAALAERRVDIVHANDFDTLPAAALVTALRRARLVYDSHELYTTQEIDPPRGYVAVAHRLERWLARRSFSVVTTGEPFAEELRRRFALRKDPIVWLNCPSRWEGPDRRVSQERLRVVYQAAMGPGRPLQDVLDAAMHAPSVDILIRVVGADRDALMHAVLAHQLEGRVSIADPVPPERMLDALAAHDVGVIINRPVTLTDELVVPNKLFEYMMAGLAVVAPDLPGVGRFVREHEIGLTFAPGSPEALGRRLEQLARDRPQLETMRRRARQLALERYNAEAQAPRIAAAWGL